MPRLDRGIQREWSDLNSWIPRSSREMTPGGTEDPCNLAVEGFRCGVAGMARSAGVEPTTFGFGGQHSIQLSYERFIFPALPAGEAEIVNHRAAD